MSQDSQQGPLQKALQEIARQNPRKIDQIAQTWGEAVALDALEALLDLAEADHGIDRQELIDATIDARLYLTGRGHRNKVKAYAKALERLAKNAAKITSGLRKLHGLHDDDPLTDVDQGQRQHLASARIAALLEEALEADLAKPEYFSDSDYYQRPLKKGKKPARDNWRAVVRGIYPLFASLDERSRNRIVGDLGCAVTGYSPEYGKLATEIASAR